MKLNEILPIISAVGGEQLTRYASNSRPLSIDSPETPIESVSCRIKLNDFNNIILSFTVANDWISPGYKCWGDEIADTFGAYVVMMDHICRSDLQKIDHEAVVNTINNIKKHWEDNKDKAFSSKAIQKKHLTEEAIQASIKKLEITDVTAKDVLASIDADQAGLNEN